MPTLALDLTRPPADAVEFFDAKGNRLTWDWRDMLRQDHDLAFTVAKVTSEEVLGAIRTQVAKAIGQGMTFAEFKRTLKPQLQDLGWWGRQELLDGETGEVTTVQLGSDRRLRTIYHTNIQTAYMAGRYKRMVSNATDRPYWKYVAIVDGRTRKKHRELDGKVFRWDDPIWRLIFPPNGFGCRCRVEALTETEFQALGIELSNSEGMLVTKEVTMPDGRKIPVTGLKGILPDGGDFFPDVGWDYNPGDYRAAKARLESIQEEKAAMAKRAEKAAAKQAAKEAERKAAEAAAKKAAEEAAAKKAAEAAVNNPAQWHARIEDDVNQARKRPEIARTGADHDKFVKAVQDAVAKGETRSVGTLSASVQKALGATSAEIKLADADVVRCALHGHRIADAPARLKQLFGTAQLAVKDGNTLHICGKNAASKWEMATLETTEAGDVLLKMLAGTTQREALELAKQGTLLLNKVPPLPPLADTDFVKAGAEITNSMPPLDPANPQDWHAELYRRVRLLGRLGAGSKNLATPTGEAIAATRMYPQAWVDVSDKLGVVHSRVSATGRGYAWTALVDRAIPDTLTEFLDLKQVKKGEGVITHCAGDVGTAIHEYAHRLQTAIPRLDRLFQRLHVGRVSKDPIEQLKVITGNDGYKDEEVTRKDHYVNPYQGKEYAVKDDKALPGGALEVITMAMEAVVGGNALRPFSGNKKMLQLHGSREALSTVYKQDREVLDLVVGTLLHFMP
jgi:SPP1 gp7 family putative phage head morphogenesis protein